MKGFITIKGSNGNTYELRSNRSICITFDNINCVYHVFNGFKKIGTFNTIEMAVAAVNTIK